MEQPNWIKTILTPFSWLYGFITSLRNLLYDFQILHAEKSPQYTISIGNITVGGTGKTPMTEYLVRLLRPTQQMAILSRGYGRKTKGFILANRQCSAIDIGDEPLQYFEKFGENITVAVCEKRVVGGQQLATLRPNVKLILLDDAFQHRAIVQDTVLLLNDYHRPFYNDMPFPAGRLRETRSGATRADAIVVTKCPADLPDSEKEQINSQIRKYARPEAPIFFSYIRYAEPLSYSGHPIQLNNVKLVAGIAHPKTFIEHTRSQMNVLEEIIFPDHHNYTSNDLEGLIKYLKNDTFVVTTEKDMVKLKPLVEKAGIAAQFAYIPIVVDFKNDTSRFNEWILQKTRNIR